jgi:hypothetical protein
MIELPGSFLRDAQLAQARARPEAARRMSLAILNKAAARVFSAPCANTSDSCPASAGELVERGLERLA